LVLYWLTRVIRVDDPDEMEHFRDGNNREINIRSLKLLLMSPIQSSLTPLSNLILIEKSLKCGPHPQEKGWKQAQFTVRIHLKPEIGE
jgi:hypothetical protein